MRKVDGLKFLLNNFPNDTVDTVFIEDGVIRPENLKLDSSLNQYWRVRCARKWGSEARLPMASIYEYDKLCDFIRLQQSKYSDIQFVIHRVNDDYFYPEITGTLAVYNDLNFPKIVIELQQVTREMLENIDKGKRPRDWDISVCFEYDFLHKFPKKTIYNEMDIEKIKYALEKLYNIGLDINYLYNKMNNHEAAYTRFNIYEDSSIILNDHRSTESFIKKKK